MSAAKSILVAGLGRHATAADISNATAAASGISNAQTIKEKVAASVAASRAAGYDVHDTQVNPSDPVNSLAALSELLQQRRWDGFMVGYGLRGLKEHTPVFEQVVELVREKAPGTKLLFSNAPDEILLTIERNFGQKETGRL